MKEISWNMFLHFLLKVMGLLMKIFQIILHLKLLYRKQDNFMECNIILKVFIMKHILYWLIHLLKMKKKKHYCLMLLKQCLLLKRRRIGWLLGWTQRQHHSQWDCLHSRLLKVSFSVEVSVQSFGLEQNAFFQDYARVMILYQEMKAFIHNLQFFFIPNMLKTRCQKKLFIICLKKRLNLKLNLSMRHFVLIFLELEKKIWQNILNSAEINFYNN